MAYAHENDLCHLDLTPSEVLVDDSLNGAFVTGDWEEVVVSPSADPDQIHTGQQIGILGYVAPEQIQFPRQELLQRGLGRLSDVYGLGGIIYYVLYDARPNEALAGADTSPVNLMQVGSPGTELEFAL